MMGGAKFIFGIAQNGVGNFALPKKTPPPGRNCLVSEWFFSHLLKNLGLKKKKLLGIFPYPIGWSCRSWGGTGWREFYENNPAKFEACLKIRHLFIFSLPLFIWPSQSLKFLKGPGHPATKRPKKKLLTEFYYLSWFFWKAPQGFKSLHLFRFLLC